MNTGIGDAENLAWKLAMVVRGRAGSPAGHLRRRAQAGRRGGALSSTSSLTGLVLGGSAPARLLRDRVLAPLMNARFVQRLIWEQASQLKVSYRRSWLPGPGDRVADMAGCVEGGRQSRLHAELGPRWVLIAAATWADGVTRLVPGQPTRRVLLVRPDAHLGWSGRTAAGLARWLATAPHRGTAGQPLADGKPV